MVDTRVEKHWKYYEGDRIQRERLNALCDAGGFSLVDVGDNRNNRLSIAQSMEALQYRSVRIVVGLLIAGGSGAFAMLRQHPWAHVGVAVGALLTLIATFDAFRAMRSPVGVEEGPLKLLAPENPNEPWRSMFVNGVEFGIRRELFEQLANGEHFRVYYASRTGELLTMEPVEARGVPTRKEPLDAADAARIASEKVRAAVIASLADVLGFTLDDLAANHAGRLSAGQRLRVAMRAAAYAAGAVITATAGVSVMVFERSWPPWISWLAFGVAAALLAITVATLRSTVGNAARSHEGVFRLEPGTKRCVMEVPGHAGLVIPAAAVSVGGFPFEDTLALTYRVYLSRGAGRLLSIEPVDVTALIVSSEATSGSDKPA